MAEAAIGGTLPNPVPGADSYYDTSIKAPVWATDDKFVRQIGRLRFYNLQADFEVAPLEAAGLRYEAGP
jgi:spore germination cell wall hydrolase CwlJ-like protein